LINNIFSKFQTFTGY